MHPSRWILALTLAPILAAIPGGARAAADVPTVTAVPDGPGLIATSEAARSEAAGYLEREFFFEGMAQSFDKGGPFESDGRWTAVPAGRAPYKERMIVRTPADPSRFNGIVFVEWLNVSSQLEVGPNFMLLAPELLREGYAYVGVSVQAAGIDGTLGLKVLNPQRYSSLRHPGDSFSYDIYSQAGQALRTPGDVAPLGELTDKVRVLIADGQSQSASRLVTYVNAIQPLAQVYDAFFINSRPGDGAPLAQTQGADTRPTIPVANPSRIRSDTAVPVMQLQTETELVGFPVFVSFLPARQPDGARVRTWEMAGTSHADRFQATLGGQSPLAFVDCADPLNRARSVPINDGPHTFVLRAALRAMRKWLENGTPPPAGAPLAMENGMLLRDPATGIVRGGVRTPQVDVPVRTLSGNRATAGGDGFCFLFGRTDEWNGDRDVFDGTPTDPSPTPEPVLSALYPTQADFLGKFDASLAQTIAAGFLLQDDAGEIRARAIRTSTNW